MATRAFVLVIAVLAYQDGVATSAPMPRWRNWSRIRISWRLKEWTRPSLPPERRIVHLAAKTQEKIPVEARRIESKNDPLFVKKGDKLIILFLKRPEDGSRGGGERPTPGSECSPIRRDSKPPWPGSSIS